MATGESQIGTPQRPRPRWSQTLLIGGSITALALLMMVFGSQKQWVGHTDVRTCFRVTDAASKEPIEDAEISIQVEPEGFCDDPPELEYSIRTDHTGRAFDTSRNCMCYGSSNMLYTSSFGSHLPEMKYRVSAPGFEPDKLRWVQSDRSKIKRDGELATLTIEIQLVRSP